MKKLKYLSIIIMISIASSQWKNLTLQDVFKNPPFEFASLGQWQWLRENDTDVFLKMDTTQ